ncbi:type VI immunity family protein [Pyxidicoccus xibeiensis]|uniref:type VI immunity family protein n=1 Tax=Pyxidicoccus xibeiensis TaxID=2906759 RepID=UPI0020A7669F|nr:type VI immunity family protein [Pyxidicoccus xibeiensis]MCP3137695.1 DUF3396 domain-containing protein [Pyxidicoccus xibeiensis]
MNDPFPHIRLCSHFDGYQYMLLRDSVNITFYLRRAHCEVMHAVLDALEAFRRAIGTKSSGYYLDYEGSLQELDANGWAFVRTELLRPEGARLTLMEVPDSSTFGHEVLYRGLPLDSPEFNATPEELTTLTFWLRTEYLEEHGPARVRELALELGARLPFNSGHAGLCFHFNEDLLGMTHKVREWCFKYPGLGIPDLRRANSDMGTRVNGVHWLTFLGQPVLGELGGAAGLRSHLRSPETTVQELEGDRAVVTLGRCPVAGDTEPERTLAPYRELARVLEPWLFLGRRPWSGFTEEDMRRWERRFLD